MRILVVYCHPDPESFQASILAALVERLQAGGHAVRVIDLYGEGFQPVLDREGWRPQRAGRLAPAQDLAAHIEALCDCEGLVFIHPTWWYGLPAMLKGWLDRVWQPGVAFSMEGGVFRTHHLAGVRRFAVVTTCGSPAWFVGLIVGDPVRRQLMRGLSQQLARRVRTCWQAICDVDRRSRHDLARARARAVARLGAFFDRG